ncbi:hypothetical protein KFE94_14160 [bacterium SCSIO 12643]|nr:hypothetical protein KFE94_14160 [bacterium SCSIO 12643]
MKYIVKRTGYVREKQPCEEAYPDVHYVVERFQRGQDVETTYQITKEGQMVKRIAEEERWTIELNSLEDLMRFIDKYGQVVINTGLGTTESPVIEIYDDWREC